MQGAGGVVRGRRIQLQRRQPRLLLREHLRTEWDLYRRGRLLPARAGLRVSDRVLFRHLSDDRVAGAQHARPLPLSWFPARSRQPPITASIGGHPAGL